MTRWESLSTRKGTTNADSIAIFAESLEILDSPRNLRAVSGGIRNPCLCGALGTNEGRWPSDFQHRVKPLRSDR